MKPLVNTAKYSLILLFLLSGMEFSFAQLTQVEWNFPNANDDSLVDISTAANSSKIIYTVGGTSSLDFNLNGASTQCAHSTGWDLGANNKWWEIEFSTLGYNNLELSCKQRSSSNGPKNFKVWYSTNGGLTWNGVTGSITIVVADDWVSGVLTNFPLPNGCANKASVRLRWIMTNNAPVSNGSTVAAIGSSYIDDINISANSTSYFRSVTSGNWNQTSIWESATTYTGTWSAATMPPARASDTIIISTGTTVNITANVLADEIAVQSGATLNYNSGTLSVNNGTGIDMYVAGTLNDASSNSVNWSASATWALSSSGTFIKSSGTTDAMWQANYDATISNVPSTANWIINKITSEDPPLTTLNAVYPNLFIQNNYSAVQWNTSSTAGSYFTGNTGGVSPVIKGNLDIGGTGTYTVNFLNGHSLASPTMVQGNVVVHTGSKLTNNQTGMEVQGNITVSGTMNYASAGSRKVVMSGSNPQTISGSGSMSTYYFEVNKPANHVTLSRLLYVYGQLQMTSGKIITSGSNIVEVINNATSNIGNALSYVDGEMAKDGTNAFVFPIGRNSVWAPIGMSAPAASTIQVKAEYFNQSYTDTSSVSPITHVSASEYWKLTPYVASPLTITLYWDDTARSGINFTTSTLDVGWYNGTTWNDIGQSAISQGGQGNVTSATVSSFGYFTYAFLPPPPGLPVELLNFSATCVNAAVNLNWTTASEINNDYFTVERSADGINFSFLMNVEGAGNSTSIRNYFEKDMEPLDGISYYRLKQTDYDGKFSYSKIIPVKVLKNNLELNNIFSDKQNQVINLQVYARFSSNVQLNIFNTDGQKIYSGNIFVKPGGNFLSVPANQFSNGIYTVQIIVNDQCTVKKFIY